MFETDGCNQYHQANLRRREQQHGRNNNNNKNSNNNKRKKKNINNSRQNNHSQNNRNQNQLDALFGLEKPKPLHRTCLRLIVAMRPLVRTYTLRRFGTTTQSTSIWNEHACAKLHMFEIHGCHQWQNLRPIKRNTRFKNDNQEKTEKKHTSSNYKATRTTTHKTTTITTSHKTTTHQTMHKTTPKQNNNQKDRTCHLQSTDHTTRLEKPKRSNSTDCWSPLLF